MHQRQNDLRARQQGGLTRSVDTHPSRSGCADGKAAADVISGDVPDSSLGTVSPFSGSNLKAFDLPTPQLSLDKPLSESAWGASLLHQFFC